MNTILAATDFTPSSLNACLFAAMLAKKTKSRLVVFNLNEIPVAHTNSGLFFISYSAIRENNEERMSQFLPQIRAKFPKVMIQSLFLDGVFKEEVSKFIKQHKIKAVVMGLGAKTKLGKFIFGSHSTDIAGKISVPVIIVPEKCKEHNVRSISLCVDNNEKLFRHPLSVLDTWSEELHARVKVLHVRTEDELFHPEKLSLTLRHKPVKIESIFAKSIQEGVNLFNKKNHCDMVVVLSKSHSPLYDLFAETTTKKIAFTSKIPVMAIHE